MIYSDVPLTLPDFIAHLYDLYFIEGHLLFRIFPEMMSFAEQVCPFCDDYLASSVVAHHFITDTPLELFPRFLRHLIFCQMDNPSMTPFHYLNSQLRHLDVLLYISCPQTSTPDHWFITNPLPTLPSYSTGPLKLWALRRLFVSLFHHAQEHFEQWTNLRDARARGLHPSTLSRPIVGHGLWKSQPK